MSPTSRPISPSLPPKQSSNNSLNNPTLPALELSSYLFLANLLQLSGLQTTTATRAAFTVQLTTVTVPLLESLLGGRRPSAAVWSSCALALSGLFLMGLDGSSSQNLLSGAGGISGGDVMVVGASLLYSLHVVRLSDVAGGVDPLQLAREKAKFELLFGLASIGALLSIPSEGTLLSSASSSLRSWLHSAPYTSPSFASLFLPAAAWTGVVTCAYTIYAQSYGQRYVTATKSNLIYTAQPLFSAAVAAVLVGERLGGWGVAGAAVVMAAVGGAVLFEDDGDRG